MMDPAPQDAEDDDLNLEGSPSSDEPLLTSLLWEDILFKKILPRLTIPDLFNLRLVSKKCLEMVEAYFHEMSCLNLSPFAHKFRRKDFAVLARCCRNLKLINLTACDFLTPSLLVGLFSRNHKIKVLVLDKTSNLESSCLQPVVINSKGLKVLRLSDCAWITEGCLQALTLHLQNLEVLDLSYCLAATRQRFLDHLLSKLTELRILRLAGLPCYESTLSIVLRTCKKLRVIDLSHGQSSSKRLRDLIERLPELKYVDLRSHLLLGDAYSMDELKTIGWERNHIVVLTNCTFNLWAHPYGDRWQ